MQMNSSTVSLPAPEAIETRVEALLADLTLEEKAGLMLHDAKPVERLGIPAYNWWNECLHGVGRAGRATVFPQPILTAATFDPDLVRQIGEVVSLEARAKHHAAKREDQTGRYFGLSFWTPNVNIFRDPRWGRGHETYGEDPFLSGQLGVAMVRGLQGNHPEFYRVATCVKHFAVHSGPEHLRHEFDAKVSPKDLEETYLPHFRTVVRSGVEGVMAAYNSVNGEAACASDTLLREILRERWGFTGHVVSDCWAISDIYKHHKMAGSYAEAAAMAVKAGCDLNCGCTYEHLGEAVEQGLLTEDDIDACVRRLLRCMIRLGLLDDQTTVPLADTPMSVVGCDRHRSLAREAAAKGCVLLKNNGVLPLRGTLDKVMVTGPNAASVDMLMGNYFGLPVHAETIVEGLGAAASPGTSVQYLRGTMLDRAALHEKNWIYFETETADATIACMGLSPLMEGEEGECVASESGGDRDHLGLPPHQVEFLRRLKEKEGNAPVIVLLSGGSAIIEPEVYELADAIMWIGYPGEAGGGAIADLLYGKANPSGRMPFTTPMSADDLPPFEDYRIAGQERTYRYATKAPLYPFGFGLSYTTFAYESVTLENPRLLVDEVAGEGVIVTVGVRNTGEHWGEEVVQVYVHDKEASAVTPHRQLAGFARVALSPGESRRVEVGLHPSAFEVVGEDGSRTIERGDFEIIAGGACPIERSTELGAPEPIRCTLTVTDT